MAGMRAKVRGIIKGMQSETLTIRIITVSATGAAESYVVDSTPSSYS